MYLEGVLKSFVKFNNKLTNAKESFIQDLILQDYNKEEAEYILLEIEEILKKTEQKRNFSSIFVKPTNVPQCEDANCEHKCK